MHPKVFIQERLAHFSACLAHCRCALLAQKIGERILYVVSSTMYLHVVGCSLWEAKLLVVFWKRLQTQYCFVLLKESLRHHSVLLFVYDLTKDFCRKCAHTFKLTYTTLLCCFVYSVEKLHKQLTHLHVTLKVSLHLWSFR